MTVIHRCGIAAVVGAVAIAPQPASAQETQQAFRIAAGPAEPAINEFAKQAGINVLAAADLLEGVVTNAVDGRMTADRALAALLHGTRLAGQFNAGGAVFIRRAAPARPVPGTAAAASTAASTTGAAGADIIAPVATITVPGYRASLLSSARDKQASVGVVDTISSEDFGKFPDQNAAESLARVPGVSVGRDITGEGMNVQIRGLGSSFTKILVNGAPLAVASGGPIDSFNYANREVDLDLLPTDLFSKMTVTKTATAAMLEGGAAGIVDLRSARPFDRPGRSLVANVTRQKQEAANGWGQRGALIASRTWGDRFGLLAGIAFNQQDTHAPGFGSVGWTNPNLSASQHPDAGANATGGGGYAIPAVVPAGAGAGLAPGTPIDQAFLLAHNPGLTIGQIDNALIPRLGRIEDFFGTKKNAAAVIAAEYRPGADLHWYLDTVFLERHDRATRVEYTWAVRNNAPIPLNMTVDRSDCSNGCTVTSATFANARFQIEDRPYDQRVRVRSFTPGVTWQVGAGARFSAQLHWSSSRYAVEAPTIMPITAAGSGLAVNYTNGTVPRMGFSQDVDDPTNFAWTGGRVNLGTELRATHNRGGQAELTLGDASLHLKAGLAYDDAARRIRNIDSSGAWQAAVCGNNPSVYLPGPNDQPACTGASTPGASAAALYPGYGAGATAGQPGPVNYQGSLIPAASLASYLVTGPYGKLMVDWDRFRRDSRYNHYAANASETAGSLGGYVRERAAAMFFEMSGAASWDGRALRYNAGTRYVRTYQTVGSFNAAVDARNAGVLASGARYPNATAWQYADRTYDRLLPSVSAALTVRADVVARLSASRTMTRANPTAMRPGVIFNSASADVGALGNPDLDPYSSDNLDLGLDWFTGREGYVSVTAFAKRIKGFTVIDNLAMPFGALAQYGITYDALAQSQRIAIDNRGGPGVAQVVMQRERNAGGALNLKGLELGWVQPLDRWLPWRGFGLNETLTLITQKAGGDGANGYVALGVPKKTNSVGIYYENFGIMVRLSQAYTGPSQLAAGNQNGIPAAALFNASYRQTDFSSSIDLEKVLGRDGWPTLSFNVTNLNEARRTQYFQFENATYSSYDPGRRFQFGLRASF